MTAAILSSYETVDGRERDFREGGDTPGGAVLRMPDEIKDFWKNVSGVSNEAKKIQVTTEGVELKTPDDRWVVIEKDGFDV